MFLFIGAPLGAIIRKGGFGYPMLVSIIMFSLFIVLNIMCRKLMMSRTLDAMLAAWLPLLVLFPIGVYITYAAMHDIKFQIPVWVTDNALLRWAEGRRLKLQRTENSEARD